MTHRSFYELKLENLNKSRSWLVLGAGHLARA